MYARDGFERAVLGGKRWRCFDSGIACVAGNGREGVDYGRIGATMYGRICESFTADKCDE